MAAPSVTNTFTNGTTADATQVNQNFTDVINGITDGTKDLTFNDCTVNGAAVFNSWQALYLDNDATDGGRVYFDADGTTYIGCNAAGTDITVTGSTTFTVAPLLVVADGSTAAPSIYSSTGTSDTGISMATADQIHFSAAGTEIMEISSSEVVINDVQGAVDFRVEGDTSDHVLFVDASTDSVGIKTSSIDSPLHVTNSSQNHIRMTRGANYVYMGIGGAGDLNFIPGDGGGDNTAGIIIRNDSAVYFPGISTTGSGANAFLDSGTSNSLLRSTSSLKYKEEVEDLKDEESGLLHKLRAVTYKSKIKTDDQSKRFLGLIAEEVYNIEPRLVHMGIQEEGGDLVPDGVQYDRLTVLLLQEVQKLRKELDLLKGA
jgi:hypothetical protein